ncbi:iron ABC transporter permease [Rasiella rasia]|uniref:Iron ABC transporter permease n=1 Tax=Rasiella rasia TaxID=2744027 RepID=A0A6G6GQM9_9FLAO|nr:iron ABC transporter permease [Rasiella rasia]QIE60774.1 iron ABC transporter permease [Rasiella rasia]
MSLKRSHTAYFWMLLALLIISFLVNISLGSVSIPFKEIIATLFGGDTTKETWHFILLDYRMPKAFTAVLTGSGLAIAGLLMQTLFRNPLAGPFVLGLSSGASLGVAILILGAGSLTGFVGGALMSQWSLVLASALGSFLVLLAVLTVTLKIKDTMAILIIGLMFGSVTAAVVSVLSYFTNAEKLQQYIFWSFGSLGNQTWSGVGILTAICLLGILMAFASGKSLNALLLGENYAKSMGVRMKRTTIFIILATSLLAGGITAFVGPIAFVGLAVPHITRQFFKTSNHFVLLPAVMLCGSILMLLCDTVAQLPYSEYTLPINAITSLLGAPVVIWLLVRKRKLLF